MTMAVPQLKINTQQQKKTLPFTFFFKKKTDWYVHTMEHPAAIKKCLATW